MNRNNGFYWVWLHSEWEVAEYEDGLWWLCGADVPFKSDDLQDIGARIER
jgi:hypothetical protein